MSRLCRGITTLSKISKVEVSVRCISDHNKIDLVSERNMLMEDLTEGISVSPSQYSM